jgi:hypothetical protein
VVENEFAATNRNYKSAKRKPGIERRDQFVNASFNRIEH